MKTDLEGLIKHSASYVNGGKSKKYKEEMMLFLKWMKNLKYRLDRSPKGCYMKMDEFFVVFKVGDKKMEGVADFNDPIILKRLITGYCKAIKGPKKKYYQFSIKELHGNLIELREEFDKGYECAIKSMKEFFSLYVTEGEKLINE